jgi:hypothetical protein
VAAVCSGATIAALPTTSTNAVTGTWSPAINNLATTTYTFTPTAGLCANTATMTITVTPKTTPTFTQVASVCSGATIAALPTTSTNAVTGTWSPAINNLATTTYTFTPTAGLCANTTTMTISVNSAISLLIPTFTAIAPICNGSANPLTTVSNNGIVGTWSPVFDSTVSKKYTFTPTPGQCANRTTLYVTVKPLTPVPVGNNIQTVCTGATLADLTFTGTAIKWYAAATGGAPLAMTTPIINGNSYYASQTVNGCESKTRAVKTVYVMDAFIVASSENVCAAAPVTLSVSDNITIPAPIQNPEYSGYITSDYTQGATVINNMGLSYATQGMFVYGDGTQQYGAIEASIKLVLDTSPNPSAGIAMAVKPNPSNENDELYNGPGSYFLSIEDNRISLFNGTTNEGAGYEETTELAGVAIPGLVINNNLTTVNKLRLEIKPNAHVYGYLNNVLYIDYTIPGGIVPSGKFALVNSNSKFEFTSISSYYTPNNYVWSTGATTTTITPSPTQTTTYWVDIITNEVTCRKFKTITVTPSVVPQFSPVSQIAAGTPLSALPTTSLNGIAGSWSPALNNTSTTVYTFTPNAGQCASTTQMTILVISGGRTMVPLFATVAPICKDAVIAALPTTSINGIVGTWSPEMNNKQTTQYTFSPAEGQMAAKATMTIEVLTTSAPIGLTKQPFLVNKAMQDIEVVGSEVVWYHSEQDALADINPIAANEEVIAGNRYYAVQTISGCRSTSALEVSITSVLSENSFELSQLKYYPNPVIDVLTFVNTSAITKIQLFDTVGKLILEVHPNSNITQLDMGRLASAMYIISIESQQRKEMIKILKR